MLAFPSSLTQRTRARNLDKSRRPASKLLEIERLEQRELLDAGSFVTNLYHDLLHRAPGTQELGGWEAFLQNGGSTTQVARTFVASEEYRTDLIQSDYQNFLGRQGSPPEISAWLQSNPSPEQIEVQFLGSNEYFAEQGATAEGWIAGLYQEVLGRNPDSSDSTWLAQLSAGASRSTVATEITNSTEAREQSITAAYEQLLGRAPDAQGMQHWLALLNQGETTTDMVVGITGSAEYANKPASKEIESGITISAANTTNLTSPTSVAVFGQTVTFTAAVTVPPGSGTPSGNVSFLDGTTSVGTSTLSNGQALLSISSLAVGAHSITAVYQGNSNFESSTSQAFLETINQALTTTSLTSSASPTVFGQAVTFNAIVAAVAPGTGTPGGSVTFLDGSTSLGSASLSSGQASFTISTLSAGTHSITAVYQGSTSFASSTTTALSQVINQATTATTLTSSASPTVSGQAVTFTAIVAAVPASAGTPGGSVTFLDGSTSLGSASLSNGGLATFTIAALTVGTHSITAVYHGDTSFASSSTAALGQIINQATTATTLTSSASTAVFGQAVTFKAIVAAVAPGAGTPSGSVTFLDGSTSLGSASLSSGQATFTISTLSAGTHSITAVYQGSTSFASSTTTALSQVINRATTATTLTSSASTAVFGQAVTFTAIVAAVAPGAGTPSGSVTFLDGSTSLGSASLASGHATLTLSTLSAGTHSITAVYQGSTSFASSTTTALSQVINRATTATTLTSSASTAVFGQAVTFTAIVAAVAPGAGTPGGSVTFLDGSTSLGSASLSSGQASFTISTLSLGTHSITAVYQGSTSFASSTTTSLSQVINPATTATTLTSSASPTVSGQAVTFTAIVAAVAPGAGTPSGSVTFLDGSTSLGSASLSSGQASFTISTLSLGTHSITAVYQGSTSFASSTTTALSQVINQATTATTLTSSASPTVTGQAVTFTAIVAVVAPGAGTPSGSVTFIDKTTTLGSVTLSSGQATFTISTLNAGTHSITAAYHGNSNFTPSSTAALGQTVNQATTATTLTSSASTTVFGQAVTFTATVATVAPGSGTPGGSITFLDGTTALGSASLSNGQAIFTISTLSGGTHSVSAVYQGSTNFVSSSSLALGQIINQAPTATTLTSSASTTVFGQAVTFTAFVAAVAPGAGIPSGNVTFMNGNTSLGFVSLSAGQATLTISTLTAGTHSITAKYQGSTNFAFSTTTALGLNINQAATATTLTSLANPAAFGQTVTLIGTVTLPTPGPNIPSGIVTFLDGGTSLGNATLVNGQATMTFSTLSVGTHSLKAVYGGDANFLISTSPEVSQGVNVQVATQTTNTVLVSSVDPVVSGQPVTFTVAVAPAISSLVIPTGTVTFTIDGVSQPAVALTNGLANLTVPTMSAGSHSVVGSYSGDASFSASTSATFTEVANSTYVAPWQAPGLNVTNYGVVGDGVTDNTVALQNLINSSPAGTLFYFPAGTYLIAGTVSFASLATFGIIGDTTPTGLPASVIKGTATSGDLISAYYTGFGTFQISNMEFAASDAGETAFYSSSGGSSSFQNCIFKGHIGLDLEPRSWWPCGTLSFLATAVPPAARSGYWPGGQRRVWSMAVTLVGGMKEFARLEADCRSFDNRSKKTASAFI